MILGFAMLGCSLQPAPLPAPAPPAPVVVEPVGIAVGGPDMRLKATVVAEPSDYSSAQIEIDGRIEAYALNARVGDSTLVAIETERVTLLGDDGTVRIIPMDTRAGTPSIWESDRKRSADGAQLAIVIADDTQEFKLEHAH